MSGLCDNPDCGAFFEFNQPPVRRWDREMRRIAWLCQACARTAGPSGRYEKLDEDLTQREE